MSKDASQQSPELTALIEDLRMHRVDRRTFLMKAAASGITMAAASALATDALAQAPSTAKPVTPAKGGAPKPPRVETRINVRLPEAIRLSKSDLDNITAEFNDKLIQLIKRGSSGGGGPGQTTKYVDVSQSKAVDVNA